MIVKRIGRDELNRLVDCLFHPAGTGLTADDIDKQLLIFCLNCPDPGAAMDLVLEAAQGITAAWVVDQALAMTPRSVETWSDAEISMDHPLRHWKLEE